MFQGLKKPFITKNADEIFFLNSCTIISLVRHTRLDLKMWISVDLNHLLIKKYGIDITPLIVIRFSRQLKLHLRRVMSVIETVGIYICLKCVWQI